MIPQNSQNFFYIRAYFHHFAHLLWWLNFFFPSMLFKEKKSKHWALSINSLTVSQYRSTVAVDWKMNTERTRTVFNYLFFVTCLITVITVTALSIVKHLHKCSSLSDILSRSHWKLHFTFWNFQIQFHLSTCFILIFCFLVCFSLNLHFFVVPLMFFFQYILAFRKG